MKRSRIHHAMVWTMVTAYLSLLAHAFVPHHHHGSGTAFLNHKVCPFEQQSCHGDENDHKPAANAIADCETLKHTWLKTSTQDDYSFERVVSLVWAIIPLPRYTDESVSTTGKKPRIPWLTGHVSTTHKECNGLRGPPSHWTIAS